MIFKLALAYVVFILIAVAVLLYIASFFVPSKSKNQTLWCWLLRGPIKEERQSEHGVYVQYANNDIFLFMTSGEKLDMTDVLYFKPRTWHLCGTRYGENGVVATVSNYCHNEVLKLVAQHYGTLTSCDIITGLISYRCKSVE